MRVVLSTIRRDHIFDLARQLHRCDSLTALFTGYPMFRLKDERLPEDLIKSFPWIQTVYMATLGQTSRVPRVRREIEWWAHKTLDDYTARKMPECDVFYGFAGCALRSGRKAQKQGSIYLCDRPNSPIRYQDTLLQDEYDRHGLYYRAIERRIIEKEEAEYEACDAIIVPSTFAQRAFVESGYDVKKIRVVPYGVNLTKFHPVAKPEPDSFNVLFAGSVSLRKGIPYLLQSFERLEHPKKQLTIVGGILPEVEPIVAKYAERLPIRCVGNCKQNQLKEIMSRSHVLALPSIEEGFGLVIAEAMACGCPVIATENSGGPDLYTEGKEGFIIPIRDVDALTERLQRLADEPDTQRAMSEAALKRVYALGGWDSYGDAMMDVMTQLVRRERVPAV